MTLHYRLLNYEQYERARKCPIIDIAGIGPSHPTARGTHNKSLKNLKFELIVQVAINSIAMSGLFSTNHGKAKILAVQSDLTT